MHLEILCDLDEIVAALLDKWLALYNKDHNDSLNKNTVKWDGLAKQSKIGHDIYKYLHQPGFFADLNPIEGAVESLQEFVNDGHEVTILSAPSYPGPSAVDKLDWCKKHLPFIHHRSIMLGWRKEKVAGDILIDDSPENIKKYRERWPNTPIFTIAYNHNQDIQHLTDLYAHDCNNTKDAWEMIRYGVRTVADRKKVGLPLRPPQRFEGIKR